MAEGRQQHGVALFGRQTVDGVEGADHVWTFTATGLTADTQYYYGFTGLTTLGQFRTFPTVGSAHSFTIAVSGDSGSGGDYPGVISDISNSPTWDRMRDHSPLFALILGDLHYRNLNTTDAAPYRTAYRDVVAESRVNDFLRLVPTDYIFDDHDFGPTDPAGGSDARR